MRFILLSQTGTLTASPLTLQPKPACRKPGPKEKSHDQTLSHVR